MKRGIVLKVFLLIVQLLLISCDGLLDSSSESSISRGSPKLEDSPLSNPISFSGDLTARQGTEISFNTGFKFSQDVSSGYLFSAENLPSFLTIDPTTGEITGEAVEQSGTFSNIILRATLISDPSTVVVAESLTIAINGDPLRRYAWHLLNTGQRAFSTFAGTPGVDINLYDVLGDDVTGSGVRVAVSDTGVHFNHDDLHLNALTGQHRDYSLSSPYIGDPTPSTFHGTAVTGIIAAIGWNNFGSIGVAPEAKFAGFQFLGSPQSTSIIVNQASGDFDVFNYSYGDEIFEDTKSDATYLAQLRFMSITQDSVFVKAGGNEFIRLDDSTGICASHNANMPFENESPYILLVGAANADGGKASYSNAGSNLWVSAPGGEDGESFGPAIISTDLPTCFRGLSRSGVSTSNDFEFGNAENEKCDYTALMNGTSSSTPMVSGVVALMKSINPDLKMRDIKFILASTSKKIDPTHSASLNFYGNRHPSAANTSLCTTDLELAGHEYEQGWVTNAAGFEFNNFYGFGMVDAKAAVDVAKTYTSSLGTFIETNSNFNQGALSSSPAGGLVIPDAVATGVVDSITTTSNLSIESIQIKINITHPKSGELGVELTSPSGTKSILLNVNNSLLFEGDSNLDVVLASNAFYGESAQGTWTVKVIDGLAGSTGSLVKWDLNIVGHN